MKTLLALLCALSAFIGVAQSPTEFQLVLDPPLALPVNRLVDGLITSDQGIVVLTGDGTLAEPVFALTAHNANGEFMWSSTVEATSAGVLLEPRKVVRTSAGDLFIFGRWATGSAHQYFITRLDPVGAVQWTRTYLMENGGTDYGFSSIVATSDDHLVMSIGFIDRTIAMRVDMNGDPQWARHYVTDHAPTNKNPGFDLAATLDGGVLLTEKAEDDIYLVRVDTEGDVVWAVRYPEGGYCHTNTVTRLEDGGFLIGGYTDQSPFAARVDESGQLIWHKGYTVDEGILETFDKGIELPDGSFLLTPSVNSSGILAVRLSPLGTPLSTVTIGGDGSARVFGLIGDRVVLGAHAQLEPGGSADADMLLLSVDQDLALECMQGTTGITAVDITTGPPILGCEVGVEPVTEGDLFPSVTNMLFATRPLCQVVNSIPEPQAPEVWLAGSNLIRSGDPLIVDIGALPRVRLLRVDTDGRSRDLGAVSGRTSIPTTGWAGGLYVIRAIGRDGTGLGSVRVLVD